MDRNGTLRTGLLAFVTLFGAASALAVPLPEPVAPAGLVSATAGNCYAIGQQVAEQNGGTLAKATDDVQGGQPVCRIVVLVKGKEGERPRRTEVVVPQN